LSKKKQVKKIIILDNLEDGSKKNIKVALSNKKVRLFKRNINNLKSIMPLFKNIDLVIHFAALSDVVPSIEKPKNYLNTNINGTLNVLECMRHHSIKKIIYSASSSCYGNKPKVPTDEECKINTKYPYAFSKYIGEQAIVHWSKVYKINFVSLRLFNVFGTRSRTTGSYGAVMGVFLKQKLSNKNLTVVGNGQQKRDFIYVTDVVKALIKSMYLSKRKNYIFNIGSSKPIKILDLVKIIGVKYVKIPKRPGEPSVTCADIKKAKKILKWSPKVSFKDGMSILLKNINYWNDAPLWTKSKIKNQTKNWFKFLK
jgi:UDP-glucose 4-epimerase